MNNNDYFRDICLDRLGNVCVTGISADIGHNGWDIATIMYDTYGDTVWINRYNPSFNSNDESSGIASDKFGNIYVTGSSDESLFAKMITIQYSSNGNQNWITYYNNNNPFTWHSGAKVKTDTLGNLIVAGRSQNNSGNVDIVTIKYSSLTNYQNPSTMFYKNNFELYQNYPNPFNSLTLIKYFIPIKSNVSVKVYNVLGIEVTTLVNELKDAGTYKIQIDGTNLPSGIYIYTLATDGIIRDRKKFILLK